MPSPRFTANEEMLTHADAPPTQGKATTLNHFHEKLLLLPELMKTKTGREVCIIAPPKHVYPMCSNPILIPKPRSGC